MHTSCSIKTRRRRRRLDHVQVISHIETKQNSMAVLALAQENGRKQEERKEHPGMGDALEIE